MSNLSLERLLFDPTDPTSQPLVGSYILSASGNVIGDTSGALDMYLTNATLAVTQSGTWLVQITDGVDTLAIDGSGFITANINGTVTVTATQLDIDDLDYTVDSVTAHQGGTWSVTTDVTPDIVPLSQAISVGDTEVALPASPLTGRKRLQIQNLGSDPIAIGKTGVTYATGLIIPKGATESLEAGPNALYYGIADTGKTVAIRILEF